MEILSIVLGVFSISFFVAYIKTLNKLITLLNLSSDLNIVYKFLSDNVENNIQQSEDTHKENFIKFLSDSREWAFGYIEEVQDGLKKFIEEVEPQLEYYNNYGVVLEGMITPHDKALKKISIEFEQLKKLLPEEIDDRR
jgi:hypothetical protein